MHTRRVIDCCITFAKMPLLVTRGKDVNAYGRINQRVDDETHVVDAASSALMQQREI